MQEPPKIDGSTILSFIDWFYTHYGPKATLALILVVPVVLLLWMFYQARRKDREANLALEAKEQTIQHLAAENRLHRIQMFKEQFKWSDHQIQIWLIDNEPAGHQLPEKVKKAKQKQLKP